MRTGSPKVLAARAKASQRRRFSAHAMTTRAYCSTCSAVGVSLVRRQMYGLPSGARSAPGPSLSASRRGSLCGWPSARRSSADQSIHGLEDPLVPGQVKVLHPQGLHRRGRDRRRVDERGSKHPERGSKHPGRGSKHPGRGSKHPGSPGRPAWRRGRGTWGRCSSDHRPRRAGARPVRSGPVRRRRRGWEKLALALLAKRSPVAVLEQGVHPGDAPEDGGLGKRRATPLRTGA